jgi:WD40 repeat protein
MSVGEPPRQYPFAIEGPLGQFKIVTFSPDGRRFLAWDDDCHLREWDVTSGKLLSQRELGLTMLQSLVREKQQNQGHSFQIKATFSRDAKRLAAIHDGVLIILEVESGEELTRFSLADGRPQALEFSPDGNRIIISAPAKGIPQTHIVRALDISSGDEVLGVNISDEAAGGPLAFSPDGKHLAIANRSAGARVFTIDLASGEKTDVAESLPAPPACIRFSIEGSFLACGLSDGTALVWKLEDAGKK